MATYYIDPVGGAGGNTGLSHAQALDSMPTFASGNNYYIFRGTTYTGGLGTINNLSNIVVGSYWLDGGVETTTNTKNYSKPIITGVVTENTTIGDWVQVGSDPVWQLTVTGNHTLMGLGTLGWNIRSSYHGGGTAPHGTGLAAFTDSGYGYGQWDYTSGTLSIYSAGNPVSTWGSIFHIRDTIEGIKLLGSSSNITIENLEFNNFYPGIHLSGNTGTTDFEDTVIRNCDFERCWFGVSFNLWTSGSISTNSKVLNNTFTDIGGGTAVRSFGPGTVENAPGLEIAFNYVLRIGAAEPVGGFYSKFIGSSNNPVLIHNNYVDTVYSWIAFWEFEFRCYYTENLSNNVRVYENYGRNATGGLHDNGGYNIEFYNNIIEDCDYGLGLSDAANANNGQVNMYNNTLGRVRIGINSNRGVSATACTLRVYNNIFISDNSGTSAYMYVDPNLDDIVDGILEDNNCHYNFITGKARTISGSLVHPEGENNITTDPLLDDNYFPHAGYSPVINAGTTPPSNFDAYGRPNYGLHIGAVWPYVATSKTRRKL